MVGRWTAHSWSRGCSTSRCSRSSPGRTATATTSCAGCAPPGLEEVGDASVYGTLRRLYSAGALTSYVVPSDEGPHRKYYGINAQGRTVLETQGKTWAAFAATMDGLLDQAGVRS